MNILNSFDSAQCLTANTAPLYFPKMIFPAPPILIFHDIRRMINRNQQQEELVKLAYTKMPFGKYKDRFLSDLPEHYLLWFRQQGFPNGKLGQNLELVLELKINGMEHILRNIRNKYTK